MDLVRPNPAMRLLPVLWLLLAASACQAQAVIRLEPRVLHTYPHDTGAFTEGLIYYQGALYESTGRNGHSSLRKVDIESGEILPDPKPVTLADEYFGEGLARVGDRLIQLTWQKGTAFVYDLATFQKTGSFTYQGEGWGLCYDGTELYMSNGGSSLAVRDPDDFELLREIPVTLHGEPVPYLNELECAQGSIYANIFTTDYIVRIDPASGRVTAVIDASGLLSASQRQSLGTDPNKVLNGIAFNAQTGAFYVTGKNWPQLFEVRFE
ncbi:MAG TPA: glutaminyl-peptide cyclotransferase [Trueperaceae bacterium]